MTTVADLAWRAAQGATAGGSGEVAETIRMLKAQREGGLAPGEAPRYGPSVVSPMWVPSVVCDDEDAQPL